MTYKHLILSTSLLLTALPGLTGKVSYEFSGTIGLRSGLSHSNDQSLGEYDYNTPYCGLITYDSDQESFGDEHRGDYQYDKMIMVFPDDSDADSQSNVLVDYGRVPEDPYNHNPSIRIYNHLTEIPDDPENLDNHSVDNFVAESHGPANGKVVSGIGSDSIGGFSTGDPDNWDWARLGVAVSLNVYATDGLMFPDSQGVDLPAPPLAWTEDSSPPHSPSGMFFGIHEYFWQEEPLDYEPVHHNSTLKTFQLAPIQNSSFDHPDSEVEYLLRNCDLSPKYEIQVQTASPTNFNDPDIHSAENLNHPARLMVILASQPSFNVVVKIHSTDETEGIVDPDTSELIFTPANWYNPQEVIVVGQDDDEVDGDIEYDVKFMTESPEDSNFNGLETIYKLINDDNDD